MRARQPLIIAGVLACWCMAAAAAGTPARRPHLYVAENAAHRIVLIGTKHVDISPKDYPAGYRERIAHEIQTAHRYWGETTAESAAAAGDRVSPAPQVLRQRLTRQTRRRLVERFGGWRGWRAQPCGMVASLYLSWDAVGPVVRGRAPPTRILDRRLEAMARQAGVTPRPLDSAEVSAQIDANLARAEAACDLNELVAELPPVQAQALHVETREEFLSGDEHALQARLGLAAGAAELYAVGERNRQWIAKLRLEAKGRDFVAVGVAHLYGERGLLDQLRQGGYRIERIHEPGAR